MFSVQEVVAGSVTTDRCCSCYPHAHQSFEVWNYYIGGPKLPFFTCSATVCYYLYCSLLLESERWKQVDVPAEIQRLVNTLEAGILAPGTDAKPATSDTLPATMSPATKLLVIHGDNFAVVG